MIPRALLLALVPCVLALPAGAADKRFLAFGDSITVGHGAGSIRCPDPNGTGGYPPRLRNRLLDRGLDVAVDNFGRCGETTGQGVTRIESVLLEGGDVIVIMEGTNDVSRGYSVESVRFNVNEMVRKARLAGIVPLVASAIPRGPGGGADTDNVRTRRIAEKLAADSVAEDFELADTFHAFIDVPDLFDTYYNDPLHPNSRGYGLLADEFVDAALAAIARTEQCGAVPPGPCAPSESVLCLRDGRFRLDATWKNFGGDEGVGRGVPLNDETGAFYWVDSQNIELIVKVLDGRQDNDHFWVFYGALSNLEFSLVVTDTQTGECNEYFNPLATFASVGDTAAFYAPASP